MGAKGKREAKKASKAPTKGQPKAAGSGVRCQLASMSFILRHLLPEAAIVVLTWIRKQLLADGGHLFIRDTFDGVSGFGVDAKTNRKKRGDKKLPYYAWGWDVWLRVWDGAGFAVRDAVRANTKYPGSTWGGSELEKSGMYFVDLQAEPATEEELLKMQTPRWKLLKTRIDKLRADQDKKQEQKLAAIQRKQRSKEGKEEVARQLLEAKELKKKLELAKEDTKLLLGQKRQGEPLDQAEPATKMRAASN